MKPRVISSSSLIARQASNWLSSLSPHQIDELASLDAHLLDPSEEGVTIAKDWIEENRGERNYWYYLIWE